MNKIPTFQGTTIISGSLANFHISCIFSNSGTFSLYMMGPPRQLLTASYNTAYISSRSPWVNPFATDDAYMPQLFHCLQWYAGSERVKWRIINMETQNTIPRLIWHCGSGKFTNWIFHFFQSCFLLFLISYKTNSINYHETNFWESQYKISIN